MKKLFMFLSAAILFLVVLAACGTGGTPEATPAPVATPAQGAQAADPVTPDPVERPSITIGIQ